MNEYIIKIKLNGSNQNLKRKINEVFFYRFITIYESSVRFL